MHDYFLWCVLFININQIMDKYFKPETEDIRIGYNCEVKVPTTDWFHHDTWKEFTLENRSDRWGGDCSELDAVIHKISLGEIRIPYLTKEQIEAEGWKEFGKSPMHDGRIGFEKGNYFLVYHDDKETKMRGKIEIVMKDVLLDPYTEWTSNGRLYFGQCKDINTFRYISKLLGI